MLQKMYRRATFVYSFYAVLFSCVHLSCAQNDTLTVPSTVTSPPVSFPTPTSVIVPSLEPLPVEGTPILAGGQPLPVDNNTWSQSPPASADFPSSPTATSQLSIYARGPVSYCDTIGVWWAGGVSPYSLYYMLLDRNQTVEDYTFEYTVSTEMSYGPIFILQLGDRDMQLGKKWRGLTRIRIEDATGTSKMAWVQNIEPQPHTPCGAMQIGISSPRPPQTTVTTVKFDGYTTFGPTTAIVATIDGRPMTMFPISTTVNGQNHLVQPAPNVASAPPRPTDGMQSGTIAPGGSNANIANNNNNNLTPDQPHSGPQGASGNSVQSVGFSSGTNGQGLTIVGTGHVQASNSASAANPSDSANGGSNNGTLSNYSSGASLSTSMSSTNSSSVNGTLALATSTISSDQSTSSSSNATSSSSSVLVQGVTNASNGGESSGDGNLIIFRLSMQAFALTIASFVSAVIACAGYAFFRHRRRSLRKPEPVENPF